MKKYLTHNGNLIYRGDNHFVYRNYTSPVPSVQIGNQIWTSENLSIDDGGEGIYTYDETTNPYGNLGIQKFYNHTAAVRIVNSIEGWHLPTKTEFETLLAYLATDQSLKLRSTFGWVQGNGTNESNFNALPVGNISLGGSIEEINRRICFWALDNYTSSRWYCLRLNQSAVMGNESDSFAFSVRLVKDA